MGASAPRRSRRQSTTSGAQNYDKPGKIFPLLYRVLLGQERGPRLGAFIKLATPERMVEIAQQAPRSSEAVTGAISLRLSLCGANRTLAQSELMRTRSLRMRDRARMWHCERPLDELGEYRVGEFQATLAQINPALGAISSNSPSNSRAARAPNSCRSSRRSAPRNRRAQIRRAAADSKTRTRPARACYRPSRRPPPQGRPQAPVPT